MSQEYFSDKQLAERFSVSRVSIWRWVKHEGFPPPIKLSACCTRWTGTSIDQWEDERSKVSAAAAQ